jgi:hypothetical protein
MRLPWSKECKSILEVQKASDGWQVSLFLQSVRYYASRCLIDIRPYPVCVGDGELQAGLQIGTKDGLRRSGRS